MPETKTRKPTRARQFVTVRREGGSAVVTLGNIVPPDWKLIERIELDKNLKPTPDKPEYVTVKFVRVR
jgi:hypothetical protein